MENISEKCLRNAFLLGRYNILFSLVYAMRYVNQIGYSLSVHDHVRLER